MHSSPPTCYKVLWLLGRNMIFKSMIISVKTEYYLVKPKGYGAYLLLDTFMVEREGLILEIEV
jgi:hypothetical protein